MVTSHSLLAELWAVLDYPGDRDLLVLGTMGSVRVISPAAFERAS
jgi:hypothetical protein